MERWQTNLIKWNKAKLIQYTHCNANLLAKIQAKEMFSSADIENIESKRTRHEKSKLLYDLIETRTNGFLVLTKALLSCRQTGASQILLNGTSQYGLCETWINISGAVKSFKEIFSNDDIRQIDKSLQEKFDKKSYLEFILKAQRKRDAVKLVHDNIPNQLPYYIPRSLSKRVQISSLLFKEECSDIFVFKGISRARLTDIARPYSTAMSTSQLFNVNCRFISLENDNDWDNICNASSHHVHQIKYEENENKYILEASTFISDTVRKFILETTKEAQFYISELEFMSIQNQNCSPRGVCICDIAGIGKTTVLANLARHAAVCPNGNIVAFIRLTELIQIVSKPTQGSSNAINDALLQILNHISTSAIAVNLLNRIIKSGNFQLQLFLDGFDEIHENDISWTKTFLRQLTLSTDNIKLFITSRSHHRQTLEHTLGVIAYDILPFNEENKLCFLSRYWKHILRNVDDSSLKRFAVVCLKQLDKTLTQQDRDLMGIPLLCYLLAENYKLEANIFATPGRKICEENKLTNFSSIYGMYKNFTELRFGFSEEQAERSDSTNAEINDKIKVKNFHIFKALDVLYPAESKQFAQYEDINDAADNSLSYLSVGILQTIGNASNLTTVFVHRTIAEFLVTEYLAKFLFGSHHIATNSEWADTVIKLCTDRVFMKCGEETKRITYQRRLAHPYFSVSGFCQPGIIHFLNSHLSFHAKNISVSNFIAQKLFAHLTPKRFFENLIVTVAYGYCHLFGFFHQILQNVTEEQRSLYRECFVENLVPLKPEISNVHAHPAYVLLSMAAEFSNREMTDQCFLLYQDIFAYNMSDICQQMTNDMITPLHRAIDKVDYDLVEFFIGKVSLLDRSLLYWCVSRSYGENAELLKERKDICELLIETQENLVFEGVYSDNKLICEGPLVARWVHLDIIKLLIQKDADIRVTKYKETVVHYTARYMSSEDFHELCKFLITECNAGDLFRANKGKWTNPLHQVLQDGKSFPIDMILDSAGVSINEIDEEGHSLLLSAVKGEVSLDDIKLLVARGADIYFKNEKGQNSLHLSAQNGSIEKIEYFISLGISLNELDNDRNSALLLASEHFDSVMYLLNQNAAFDLVDKKGETIAHKISRWISAKNFHAFVDLVIHGFNAAHIFKLLNARKETPLHIRLRLEEIHETTLEILLCISGLNINSCDDQGNNLFLLAVLGAQDIKILGKLKTLNLDYKATNFRSENCLHLAVKAKHVENVQWLLKLDVDLNCKNKYSQTPLEQAKERLEHYKENNIFKEDVSRLEQIIDLLNNTISNKDNQI